MPAQTISARALAQGPSKIEDLTVNLLMTRRCNYSCLHCMYASGPAMPADTLRDEDLRAIEQFLAGVCPHLPQDAAVRVNFIGGEPSLDTERLASALATVADWEFPGPSGADNGNDGNGRGTRCPEMEMTTNGWWLESFGAAANFARATHGLLGDDRLTVRISNSAYHDEFRSPNIRHLFKDEPNRVLPYGLGRRTASRLEEHLQELIYETCEGNEEEGWNEPPDAWLVEELRKAASEEKLYIDSKTPGPQKVSPVGRAKTNGIGQQDGECDPFGSAKFTFMPTKEGQRPGRLYDACCNGGKVALGFADEGLALLLRRALFIHDLHQTHPLPEGNRWQNPNPGCGSRCAACPSFGAKWLKENRARTEKKVAAALKQTEKATEE